MEGTKVYAVGFASLTGRRRYWPWRKRMIHDLVERLVYVAHQKWVPFEIRQKAMWYALQLRPIRGGSISNATETDLLALIFNATPIADIADDDQSSPASTLTVALHTSDPGETGDQTTNEAAYTDYARETVARTSGGWTVSGNSVSPVANIEFTISGASGSTITHFSIGSGVSDDMMFSGTVTPNIAVGAAGITPILTTATTITLD